ncbi:MAG TPA: hypothetical protein PKM88_04025 [bacterium]|nr:hypothetical protein [bacterium]
MDIEIAALCDAATEQAGKLNLLGTFDRITTSQFPFIHPLCAVVYRIRFNWPEQGPHAVKVNFIDADGRSIVPPLENTMEIRVPQGRESSVANLILLIQGLRFTAPGLYAVDLTIDGNSMRSLPLTVERG